VAAVDPHGRETEALRRRNVVEQALRHVQDPFRGRAEPGQRPEEVFRGRLVRADLSGCDDPVELDAERSRRAGEQVVVDVGDDRETVPRLQRAKRVPRVRERRPLRKRRGQNAALRIVRSEAEPPPSPSTTSRRNDA